MIITVDGFDKDGKPVSKDIEVTVKPDGSYEANVPAEIADGSPVDVEANTTDRNGKPVGPATDAIEGKTDHDNDPSTPDQGGLDRVDGKITVEVDNKGKITGTTQDVKPGEKVIITVDGFDKDGKPVSKDIEVTVKPDGSYEANVPAEIADGSPVDVEANTTDRNGKPVGPATDAIEGKTDHDNDPSTPDQGGLDRVDGKITVEVDNKGKITGTTTDVEPNTDVVLTITGKNTSGTTVTVTKTVKTDASGNYTSALKPADGIVDGSAVTVVANTTDRNGKPVTPAIDSIGPQGDNDNDPSTPEDTGLDLVDAEITVDIVDANSTKIIGTTIDVAPNSTVTLKITSIDENGETLSFSKTVQTDVNGNYSYDLTLQEGNATNVIATVKDRNGNEQQANDQLEAVVKADPTTDVNNGDNDVSGTSGNDVLAGDTGGLKTNFKSGEDYNVSIVLDLSGSMNWNLTNNNSAVPPALSRLDIAKAGLKAFVQQMVDHDGVINLQLVSFSASGNNTAGDKFNETFLQVSQSNLQDILNYIDSFTAEGGTNPERGFDRANQWFDTVDIAGATQNGFENQTYYLTDGDPSTSSTTAIRDTAFNPLAEKSKVFAVGISDAVKIENVYRYDNTDVNGNKLSGTWNGSSNHGTAQKFTDADKLIAYLIGGSENFIPVDVGNDTVKGGAGDDILFGDAMNTNWITWASKDTLMYPKYSGYSTLTAYLKAEVTGGAEPTQQEIYDYVKAHYKDFINADATDSATKGGNDTIYGGAGNDIIIAGAGDDIIYGGSGDDIISTGSGDDTIMYNLLNAADATGGNGTDTWVDYEANDKIKFGAGFFDGLLSSDLGDVSKVGEFITVEDDGKGNTVIKVDRDGANVTTGGTHDFADLLVIEKTNLSLQDLLNNNQIIIG
ncbi:Leukotoxin [compost metagenome]